MEYLGEKKQIMKLAREHITSSGKDGGWSSVGLEYKRRGKGQILKNFECHAKELKFYLTKM